MGSVKGIAQLHVAVDLDDVTVDFMKNVFDCFEREFGVRPEWNGAPWGREAVALYKHPLLLAAGYKDWWGWLRARDWLWGIAPAVPGAIGGISTLRARGHYVEAVTSKPEWAEPQVWRWLGKWRPPFEAVTITKHGQSKADATRADIIIDDKLETCIDFTTDGREAVWFNRATDAGLPPSTVGLHMARSWAEVLDMKELA